MKSSYRKVILAPGHGGQSFWGRSNSPRRRRPCTSSISTTTLISGAFTICRYITQSYLCRKARLNPLRRLWQAPGEAFERLIVDCVDDLKNSWLFRHFIQSPATCTGTEACQHCKVHGREGKLSSFSFLTFCDMVWIAAFQSLWAIGAVWAVTYYAYYNSGNWYSTSNTYWVGVGGDCGALIFQRKETFIHI